MSSKRNKKKRYTFEFSGASLLFWSSSFLFLLVWVFALGIFVGRGLLPESVQNLDELKEQIASLKKIIRDDQGSDAKPSMKGKEDPQFAFFEKLAEKKEATLKHKTSPIAAVGRRENASVLQDPPVAKVIYTVQVASLETQQKAADLVRKLTHRGYPVFSYKVNVKGKEYYRVMCGKFKTEKEAGKQSRLLEKREGIKGFVYMTED
jgi:cell division protein FtsN